MLLFYTDRLTEIRSIRYSHDDDARLLAIIKCRLLLEQIVFDRLEANERHLGGDVWRRWKPKEAISFLVASVTDRAVQQYSVSISADVPKSDNPTANDFKLLDWTPIGRQSSLDVHTLNKLWHKLSSRLHHMRTDDSADKRREREVRIIDETLSFADKINEGNLMGSLSMGAVVVTCQCGQEIRRVHEALQEGHVIYCPRENCECSYVASEEEGEWNFLWRGITFRCRSCEQEHRIDEARFETMTGRQVFYARCECGQAYRGSLQKYIEYGEEKDQAG